MFRFCAIHPYKAIRYIFQTRKPNSTKLKEGHPYSSCHAYRIYAGSGWVKVRSVKNVAIWFFIVEKVWVKFGMNFASCRSVLVPPASDLLCMANFHRVAYLRIAIFKWPISTQYFLRLPAGLQNSPAGITDSVFSVPFDGLRGMSGVCFRGKTKIEANFFIATIFQ